MIGLTRSMDEKTNKISALLSDVDPKKINKLLTVLESGDDGATRAHGVILSKLRPVLARLGGPRPGKKNPQRLFCDPFEPLLITDPEVERAGGKISRASITPVWVWLSKHVMPDTLPDICARIQTHIDAANASALKASVEVLHATAAGAIVAALKNEKERARLAKGPDGERILQDAQLMGSALAVAPDMVKLKRLIPSVIPEFEDALLFPVRDLYDEAYNEHPEAALVILLTVMARLKEPWQIMRVARSIARKDDDTMISKTDLSILGNMLITDMENIANHVGRVPTREVDLAALYDSMDKLAAGSQGLAREIDIRRWGEWGKRLLAARLVVSKTAGAVMARFQGDLERAFPLSRVGGFGRAGPRHPDLSKPLSAEAVRRVEKLILFLEKSRKIEEVIGIHADCKAVREGIDEYLMAYEDAILEEAHRAAGKGAGNLSGFVDALVSVRTVLSGKKAARIFKRQVDVATSAR